MPIKAIAGVPGRRVTSCRPLSADVPFTLLWETSKQKGQKNDIPGRQLEGDLRSFLWVVAGPAHNHTGLSCAGWAMPRSIRYFTARVADSVFVYTLPFLQCWGPRWRASKAL